MIKETELRAERELYKEVMGEDYDDTQDEYIPAKTAYRKNPVEDRRCDKCGKLKIYHLPLIVTDSSQWCICDADESKDFENKVWFNNPV